MKTSTGMCVSIKRSLVTQGNSDTLLWTVFSGTLVLSMKEMVPLKTVDVLYCGLSFKYAYSLKHNFNHCTKKITKKH